MRWRLLPTVLLAACGSTATVTTPGHDAGADSGVIEPAAPDAGADNDAGLTPFDAGHPDAGTPVVDAGVPCGATPAQWTCSADGNERARCEQGQLHSDACTRGCLRSRDAGVDSQCLTSSWAFSCPNSWGTEPSTRGDYYLTAFGCWTDANGVVHTDPGDNCIPTCLSQAKAAGVCLPTETGPECEARVTWYTADAARFGCLAHLRITNPSNGKTVIAVALDFGPGCGVERSVSFPVLDASGRVDRYLFGSDQGASDHAQVHVVEVDKSTALGPVP